MITKIFIGVLICTVLGIIVFKAIDPNLNSNITQTDSQTTIVDENNTISVGISGEVVRPGNYVLTLGSTMADLIDSAGGVNSNADERCYFFDATIENNMSYYIAPLYEIDDVCGNNPISKININNADATELDELPGIGEVMSQSIVSYRSENGKFTTLEDVMNVKGIGNSIFSNIKNKICLID